MADFDLINAAKIDVVGIPESQFTSLLDDDTDAGSPMAFDATTGNWVLATADTIANANCHGLLIKTGLAGYPGTVIRRGVVDGLVLDGLSYGDIVYLTDLGALSATPGTVLFKVGTVVPSRAQSLGVAADKVLYIDPDYIADAVEAP